MYTLSVVECMAKLMKLMNHYLQIKERMHSCLEQGVKTTVGLHTWFDLQMGKAYQGGGGGICHATYLALIQKCYVCVRGWGTPSISYLGQPLIMLSLPSMRGEGGIHVD